MYLNEIALSAVKKWWWKQHAAHSTPAVDMLPARIVENEHEAEETLVNNTVVVSNSELLIEMFPSNVMFVNPDNVALWTIKFESWERLNVEIESAVICPETFALQESNAREELLKCMRERVATTNIWEIEIWLTDTVIKLSETSPSNRCRRPAPDILQAVNAKYDATVNIP